uniref:Na(+)/H(+) exchange regulatory cofactor NHE-RF n=1 Tax=Sinocyclocheilus grahami TaxID=75366 RepID=A0A672S8X1_SINGR
MPSQTLRPRLCVLEKGENGYGFHLHGEKGKSGQFIRLVEPDSPAELSGLRAGDRLVFVNGERVESDSHPQVVARIRASAGSLQLVVVDADTDQLLQKHELKCLKEFVTEGIPVPECGDDELEISDEMMRDDTPPPVPERNGEILDLKTQLRPRLCVIEKGPNGFGFNLHSEKSRSGQFIRAIDDDSPAQRSGLRPKDRIIQVNGVSVEGKQHAEVVAAIKAGGDNTSLLVVDQDTDAFFKKCRVMPTAEHLTEVELKDSKLSISPSPSNASSNTSLTTPPSEALEPSIINAIPELNLSLQQVKERAHQKRSNKRAPPMDWSKKNELFSNL